MGEPQPDEAPRTCAACGALLSSPPSYSSTAAPAAAAGTAPAPCGRPEHATHAGHCYDMLHCLGKLDTTPIRCGACGGAAQKARETFVTWASISQADRAAAATGTRSCAITAHKGAAALDARDVQAAALNAQASLPVDIAAPSASLPEPVPERGGGAQAKPSVAASALSVLKKRMERADRNKGATFTSRDLEANGSARSSALRHTTERARNWLDTVFADPRDALRTPSAPIGVYPLTTENLVRSRVTLREIIAARPTATRNNVRAIAPAYGDLAHMELTKELLLIAATAAPAGDADPGSAVTMFAPCHMNAVYGITADILCNEVLVGGIAGLAQLGYTAADLLCIGCTAPWLLENNATLHTLHAFAPAVTLADWFEKLGLTQQSMRRMHDYSDDNVRLMWGDDAATRYMTGAHYMLQQAAHRHAGRPRMPTHPAPLGATRLGTW